MIADSGSKDLKGLATIRTLVAGGKAPIKTLVTTMLEGRTNCKVVEHWDSDTNKSFGDKSMPEVDLVFLVVDHMSTIQKETVLRRCRDLGIAYVLGQRKWATLALPMEGIGIVLKSKPGRAPEIPGPPEVSPGEDKAYQTGKTAFADGKERRPPKKFAEAWLRGWDEAKAEHDQAEEERKRREEEERKKKEETALSGVELAFRQKVIALLTPFQGMMSEPGVTSRVILVELTPERLEVVFGTNGAKK